MSEMIVCDANGVAFESAALVDAVTPKELALQAEGWLWFNNLGVNNEAGNHLFKHEQPLRASRIRVFAADVHWRYGFSFATAIRSPLGKKMVVGDEWRFPSLMRYGSVLYQPVAGQKVQSWQIIESTYAQPQEILLDPTKDIYVNINDQRGGYSDNSGSLDLFVQVVA